MREALGLLAGILVILLVWPIVTVLALCGWRLHPPREWRDHYSAHQSRHDGGNGP